jgi:RecA-family ATPase
VDALGDDGTIFVWVEPDADGFAQAVADALQRPVKAISAPDAERKDAYRLWLALNKDWDAFAQAIRDLTAQATEVIPQQPTQGKRLPDAVWTPLREITRADPNEQWQIEGLIKAGNLVILSARPKTAKSIVALNIAACIATGKPFLNRSTTQGRALFVAWERHDLTVQRAFEMGLDACEDFMIWDKCRFGVAPRVDALDWWREFIVANNIRLVVFDTLAHFLRPELDKVRNALNAYDYIGSVLERVAQIANETGCTFVLIHHDRKGEGDTDEQRVLGTTALTAAADVVLQLQPLSDDAGVTVLKVMGNAIDDQTLYFATVQSKLLA